MTFDDQLKRAFDTMSERLRAAVDRQVEIVVDELAAAAHEDREHAVSEALDGAAREAAGQLETVVAAAQAEREHAVSEARARAAREATGELESVVAAARQEAHEAGLAAGKDHGHGEGLEEGRQQGFEEGRQQGALEGRQHAELESRETLDAAVAAARAERMVDAGDTERLAESVRAIAGARSLTEILDTLVGCAGRESGHAGVWIIRGGRLRHWRSTGVGADEPDLPLDEPGAIAEAARTNAVATSEGTLAVPIAMAGQVVAVLFTNPGATSEFQIPNSEFRIPNPGAIEVLARYAARCLEALTAFKAARALTERPGGPEAEAPAASGEAIVEEDASARRYARLLVSEIKLYHEAAVVDGRRDRDLATRLGGEIARARVLYEQRVPPQVRERADYFHDELVRTLAGGDATLLQLT